MAQYTILIDQHHQAGAKIVDFAGWDMPLHYGSQINEHKMVRNDAGMFDVSHMTVVDIAGSQATAYLHRLLANNVDKLTLGKALYSCMLKEDAGIIDDLIVFKMEEQRYLVVVNAATRVKDLAWMTAQAKDFDVSVKHRQNTAMIAVQGPNAREKANIALATQQSAATADAANALDVFFGCECDNDVFISRTGYTGEDGYEIILPENQAAALWNALISAGVKPAGLGSRDTLRLEAGMNLYGTDMDETTSPLESGLGWTLGWKPEGRDFIGRSALEAQRLDKSHSRLVGLVLEQRGMLRNHMAITLDGNPAGEITSGSFSPTLGRAIAMARVSPEVGEHCQIEIRGKMLDAKVVKMPFVRHGKACIEI